VYRNKSSYRFFFFFHFDLIIILAIENLKKALEILALKKKSFANYIACRLPAKKTKEKKQKDKVFRPVACQR
jgi:hypothetical protein